MLTIRFLRRGRKNQPFFKIVVTEKEKSSTRGRFVEELGFYNPLTKEKSVNGERAKYWISKGAQPSETMHNLLISENVIKGTKIPKHKKAKKREEKTEQAPQPETPTTPEATAAPQETPAEEQKTETLKETKPEEQAKEPASEKPEEQEQPPAQEKSS